jgi:hypothetical protein
MWIWDQSAGTLSRNGVIVSKGYSGFKRGKNNPLLQNAKALGPIPQGMWNITNVYDSANVGPYALVLEPQKETNTFERSAFRIHGDNISNPGNASHGCIILPRKIRELIWKSGDKLLKVVE